MLFGARFSQIRFIFELEIGSYSLFHTFPPEVSYFIIGPDLMRLLRHRPNPIRTRLTDKKIVAHDGISSTSANRSDSPFIVQI